MRKERSLGVCREAEKLKGLEQGLSPEATAVRFQAVGSRLVLFVFGPFPLLPLGSACLAGPTAEPCPVGAGGTAADARPALPLRQSPRRWARLARCSFLTKMSERRLPRSLQTTGLCVDSALVTRWHVT